jgi:hypothetical protein
MRQRGGSEEAGSESGGSATSAAPGKQSLVASRYPALAKAIDPAAEVPTIASEIGGATHRNFTVTRKP